MLDNNQSTNIPLKNHLTFGRNKDCDVTFCGDRMLTQSISRKQFTIHILKNGQYEYIGKKTIAFDNEQDARNNHHRHLIDKIPLSSGAVFLIEDANGFIVKEMPFEPPKRQGIISKAISSITGENEPVKQPSDFTHATVEITEKQQQ